MAERTKAPNRAVRILGGHPGSDRIGRVATKSGESALFLLVHWGYGSAVGVEYIELLRVHSTARAAVDFYLLCQMMAMTLFHDPGWNPPPWRWPRKNLISSLSQHVVYAVAVASFERAVTTPR